jgi:hypothetical protein
MSQRSKYLAASKEQAGGGVWRYYLAEKDGKYELTESRLIGVPFHQSCTADGKREITCQGPNSIYGSLVELVRARWPEKTMDGNAEAGPDIDAHVGSVSPVSAFRDKSDCVDLDACAKQ